MACTHTHAGVALLAALLLFPIDADAAAQSDSTSTAPAELADFRYYQRADGTGEDRSMVITRSGDGSAALGWQCTATGMRIFLALDRHYVGNADDDVLVTWQLRDHDPGEGFWRLAETGTVAWMRIGDIVAFTRAATEADSVGLTLTDPFDNEARDARFGVAGLKPALELLGCDMRRESQRRPGG